MRKWICISFALLLCVSLVCPALAAEDVFVPSITYKDAPEVNGAAFSGNVPSAPPAEDPGETVSPVTPDINGCITVTSILQAQERTTDITEEDRQQLLSCYDQLTEGTMNFTLEVETGKPAQEPAEQENPTGLRRVAQTVKNWIIPEKTQSDGITQEDSGNMRLYFDNDEYVVKELVDVSFCREGCVGQEHHHVETLAEEGVRVNVDFQMDIPADQNLVVLCYRDGQWEQVKDVVNNGDGTVRCSFDRFGPVAFCVEAVETAQEPAKDNTLLWVILLLAELAVLVLLVVRRRSVKEKVTQE